MKATIIFIVLIISTFTIKAQTPTRTSAPTKTEINLNFDGKYRYNYDEKRRSIEFSSVNQSFTEFNDLGQQVTTGSFTAITGGYLLTPTTTSSNSQINDTIKFKIISIKQNKMTVHFIYAETNKQEIVLEKI